MVKVDIEEAEIEALEGADHIIKKLFPCFSIASYHLINNNPTYNKSEQNPLDKGYSINIFFLPHLTTCGKRMHSILI